METGERRREYGFSDSQISGLSFVLRLKEVARSRIELLLPD